MSSLSVLSLSGSFFFFFFKQKTAYEIGTGDWSSDVCSSDLPFAVILTVPLCLVGAIWGVYLRGMDNNILTQIGDRKSVV